MNTKTHIHCQLVVLLVRECVLAGGEVEVVVTVVVENERGSWGFRLMSSRDFLKPSPSGKQQKKEGEGENRLIQGRPQSERGEVWGLQRRVDSKVKKRDGSEPVECRGSASALRFRGGEGRGVVDSLQLDHGSQR
jgi:hypothetical protein